ncbi:putative ribonuclease H-like domain-containing protein [Tanacetum coccineum]
MTKVKSQDPQPTPIASSHVKCASPSVNIASPQVCTPKASVIVLDLEAMDLKWQLSLLSVRAKEGHFAREYIAPIESKEGQVLKSGQHQEEGNNDTLPSAEFKGYGPENSKKESNVVCENQSDNSKENSDKSLVKEQVSQVKSSFVEVSDDEEQVESKTKPEKKTVIPTANKLEKNSSEKNLYYPAKEIGQVSGNHFTTGWIMKINMTPRGFLLRTGLKPLSTANGCSRHMTGNIAYLSDFKQFDGGYVAFRGGAYGGKITGKGTLKTDNLDFEDDETSEILKRFIKEIENLVDKKVKIIRSDNGIEFKNKVMDDFRREKGIRENHSVSYDPQQILCCSVNGEEEIDSFDLENLWSRIGMLMDVCACARFQVTPKTSHLLAVKRIFRYLKGKPTLGLWLISWQCKKQTVVATSTTKAEYAVAASCCGQVLWIQNQLLDYGYNFMNIVINIDNNNLLTKGFDAGRFQYLVQSIGSKHSRHIKRGRDTKIPLSVVHDKVGDEAVHKELGDRMERAATTASSLEAEQDSDNIK